MCTLMACIQGGPNGFVANPPICREYFNNNQTEGPVIKSFTGPVKLNINEKGTWSVTASIFNNQPLTYNITWGDERYFADSFARVPQSISAIVNQNSTFEHSYSQAGTYIVSITVTAQNGQTTKTTSTVNVSGNNFCWNNGTQYSEGQTLTCLNTGGQQSCIADVAFYCRNGFWKIEGGLPPYRPLTY